jgi:hypothetical protein
MAEEYLPHDDDEHDAAFTAPRLQVVQPGYAVAREPEYSADGATAYRETASFAGMDDGYGAASLTYNQTHVPYEQSPPPRMATLAPNDDEMAEMVATIESFAALPAACAACGLLVTALVSSAMGGSAWKSGVLSGGFVSVGLSTVTLFAASPTDPLALSGKSGVPQLLAMLCKADGQVSACRLHSSGLLVRMLLTLGLLASLAAGLAAAALALFDANKLGPLRLQLGHGPVAMLPRVCAVSWALSAALLGGAALAYGALSPFRFRETTLQLDASFGQLRLALLLTCLCGLAHSLYVRKIRPMVASGAFAANVEHGAIAERPLEVELGLELVRGFRLLFERSRPLGALLCAQLLAQLVCVIREPQWSALLVFAGASAVAYANHHLSRFFVAATALSAGLDVLELVSSMPLALSSGGSSIAYVLMLAVVGTKVSSAALVVWLDERSGSGYSAHLLGSAESRR